jgi:PAS domain S-box-containing protein
MIDQDTHALAWPVRALVAPIAIALALVLAFVMPSVLGRTALIVFVALVALAQAYIHAIDRRRLSRVERDAWARTERLHAITASLSAARTMDDVVRVVLAAQLDAFGADAGSVWIVEEGQELRIARYERYPAPIIEKACIMPLDGPSPLCEAARTGALIHLRSAAAWDAGYPVPGHDNCVPGYEATTVVPLVVDYRVLGVMGFSFLEPRDLAPADRELALALARLGAQALDRSHLYGAAEAARAAAVDSERRFRHTADAAPVFIWTAGPDGSVDWFNQPWLDFTGRPLDALIGDGWSADVHPDDLQHCLDMYFGALHARRPYTTEYRVRRHDGMYRWMIDTGTPCFDGDGTFTGYIGSCLDITDRKTVEAERAALLDAERQARAEAEAANQAKASFLTTMSHELRTPLNAILGYTELLEMGVRGPVSAEQAEDLRRVRRASTHLLGLINDVLNYTKLQTTQVRFERTPFALDEMLVAASAMIVPQARTKGVTFELIPASELPTILLGDRDKVLQIILNLLSNAVKFTRAEGYIALVADSTGADVCIQVRDTGRGIAVDQLPAVFEPFVQVGRRLSGADEGAGLGLAISRELARGMGGDLTAISTPGEGSTFTLTLPRS